MRVKSVNLDLLYVELLPLLNSKHTQKEYLKIKVEPITIITMWWFMVGEKKMEKNIG